VEAKFPKALCFPGLKKTAERVKISIKKAIEEGINEK